MKLKISKEISSDPDFIKYLIKKLQQRILLQLNEKKLIVWNKFFKEHFKKNKLLKNIESKEIILLGLHHLRYKEYKNHFLIDIDPRVKYRYTINSVEQLCRTIDRGTLNTKGYPIFTEGMQYIENNIEELKEKYKQEGVIYGWFDII